jgi:glyoxylase-like metal-dependent hydrolase (beta-lactamase superfamily II)
MRIYPDLPLYRVTVPTPFPVGPVNLYVIAEPEFVLIDCGPRTDVARAELDRLLQEHGLNAADIQRIVLTHSHQDHYGLAAELARRSGARVYAHRDDQAAIRHDPSVRDFLAGLIAESGTPPDLVAKMHEMMFYLTGVSEAVENIHPLDELGRVPCGAARFEFVHLPGHTPGSIGLWEPRLRILLGGDTAIEKITPNPFSAPDAAQPHGRFRSLASYWETFRRIREMNPVVIHAGHLEPIADFPAYQEWSLDLHLQRQQAVLAAIRGGARTVHEIALALFPEVVPQGAFLALTEVFSHLDLLEEEGRVRSGSRGSLGRVATYREQ